MSTQHRLPQPLARKSFHTEVILTNADRIKSREAFSSEQSALDKAYFAEKRVKLTRKEVISEQAMCAAYHRLNETEFCRNLAISYQDRLAIADADAKLDIYEDIAETLTSFYLNNRLEVPGKILKKTLSQDDMFSRAVKPSTWMRIGKKGRKRQACDIMTKAKLTDLYCNDVTYNLYRKELEIAKTWRENQVVCDETGKPFSTLENTYMNSLNGEEARLYVLAEGLGVMAEKDGDLEPYFITMTAPSHFHPNSKTYAGATVRQTHEFMRKAFNKSRSAPSWRANAAHYVCAVQSHKDGTLHLHAVVWIRPGKIDEIENVLRKKFMATKADGAARYKHGIDIQHCEPSIENNRVVKTSHQNAVSYIIRVISYMFRALKENDTPDSEADEELIEARRLKALSNANGFRLFTTSVSGKGVWNALARRMRQRVNEDGEVVEDPLANDRILQITRDAVLASDFASFYKLKNTFNIKVDKSPAFSDNSEFGFGWKVDSYSAPRAVGISYAFDEDESGDEVRRSVLFPSKMKIVPLASLSKQQKDDLEITSRLEASLSEKKKEAGIDYESRRDALRARFGLVCTVSTSNQGGGQSRYGIARSKEVANAMARALNEIPTIFPVFDDPPTNTLH